LALAGLNTYVIVNPYTGGDTIHDVSEGDVIWFRSAFAADLDRVSLFETPADFIEYSHGNLFIDVGGFLDALGMNDQTGGGGDNSIALLRAANESLTVGDVLF